MKAIMTVMMILMLMMTMLMMTMLMMTMLMMTMLMMTMLMMTMLMMTIPAIQQGLQGRVEEKEEQLRLGPSEQPKKL